MRSARFRGQDTRVQNAFARHLFRPRVLKEEKGFQSSYAQSSSIGSNTSVRTGLPCLAFVQHDSSSLFFSLRRMRMLTGHSAGCTQVCVSQSNDSHLSKIFFQFLLKIKEFFEI